MKRILIVAFWIAAASYCAVAAIWGPSGILVARRANEMAATMQDNIDELARRNERYAAELESLRAAPESTALEGRSLGYLAADEVAVRLDLASEPAAPAEAGRMIEYATASALEEPRIKDIAVMAGVAALLAGMTLRAAGRTRPERKGVGQREILVQEASRT